MSFEPLAGQPGSKAQVDEVCDRFEAAWLAGDQPKLEAFLEPARKLDVAGATMRQRMQKSPAEIALIREGARVADVGGYAIRDAIRPGLRVTRR